MAIKVGDKVKYASKWLKSVMGRDAAYMGTARGTVIEIKDFGPIKMMVIDWKDERIPPKVIEPNLTKIK